MLRRHNRLLVAIFVVADIISAACAFLLAYFVRFNSGLIPVWEGVPPLRQYLTLTPFVALAVPIAFQVQRLYRLRRGRTRVDDFFAVFGDGRAFGIPPFQQYSTPATFPAGFSGIATRFSVAERLNVVMRPTEPGIFPVTVEYFHSVSGRLLYTARTTITVV